MPADDGLIRFRCPKCMKRCKAAPDFAGLYVKCRKCGLRQRVPGTPVAKPEEKKATDAKKPRAK